MMRIVLLIVIASLGLFGPSCKEKAELPKEAPLAKNDLVKVKETAKQIEEAEFRLLGQVSSQEKLLLAFKVQGNIDKILVRPGTLVKKGQVVAQLDVENYKLTEKSAELRLEQATNLKDQAERDFKVEEDLRQKDISSVFQFQNAEISYRNAIANQSLAKVALQAAKKSLEDAYLKAPVNGVISQQMKYVGDSAVGGDKGGGTFEMFSNVDPDIHLNAPESLLMKIKIGTKIDVRFPALELTLAATIVRIVPAIRESDRTFLVVVRLVQPNAKIVPGLFAEATVKDNHL